MWRWWWLVTGGLVLTPFDKWVPLTWAGQWAGTHVWRGGSGVRPSALLEILLLPGWCWVITRGPSPSLSQMFLHFQERPCISCFPVHMCLLAPAAGEAGASPAQAWHPPGPHCSSSCLATALASAKPHPLYLLGERLSQE